MTFGSYLSHDFEFEETAPPIDLGSIAKNITASPFDLCSIRDLGSIAKNITASLFDLCSIAKAASLLQNKKNAKFLMLAVLLI